MLAVVEGEPLPAPDPEWEHRNSLGGVLPLLVGVFVGSRLLLALFGRLPGALITGGLAGICAWLLTHLVSLGAVAGVLGFGVALLVGATRGWSAGGGWGGGFGGFGGGRGGGGNGGGFSGGGGGFGGGGASGSW
jgi:uncharacterized protein